VFELLGSNLFDYLRENRFRGLPLKWVRNITAQLVDVMLQLKNWRVIHCDIKPENVLFIDHNKGSVKLIDFGSACVDGAQMYSYIQSRFYRSPEVILGAKYSVPIDMWSLGCLLAELYTGRPLFPGENESDQLLSIMQVLGLPPLDVLANSNKKDLFFLPDGKPKLIPNSRGILRNPGTLSLSQLIPCPNSDLLDFITRNL
jgi:dual specificity tyrosine-phosphorylation-regulated kinase 2/3/4